MSAELIALRELAELVFGNPNRSDLAASRCAQRRVNLVTRYRRQQPLLSIRAVDVPRFLGSDHLLLRRNGWRFELEQQRRRHTRELKERAARSSKEARLEAHLEQVTRRVEQAQARWKPAAKAKASRTERTAERATIASRRRELGSLCRIDDPFRDQLSLGRKIALLSERSELAARGGDTSPVDRELRAHGLVWRPSGSRS
jgi:hypothetical protein